MPQQLSREDLKELLGIALKEYEWLRREIDQRIGARSQLISFMGAMAVLASAVGTILLEDAGQAPSGIFIGGIGVFFVLAFVYWRTSNKSIIRLGAYLEGLESRINTLTVELYGEVTVEGETQRQGVRQRSRNRLVKLGGFALALYRREPMVRPTPFQRVGRPQGL